MTDIIEPVLSPNARTIFDLRYPRKGEQGEPTETPRETVMRVVSNVASVNALYHYDPAPGPGYRMDEFPGLTARRQYEWLTKVDPNYAAGRSFEEVMSAGWSAALRAMEDYYDMVARFDFVPNSPTWTGAGTPLGQLAACFVLPIEDDLATGRDSIFGTMTVAALIQQTGGGNGFSFSHLRPNDALVIRSMGRASGPIGFLQVYDHAFVAISQGGSRRGANMGVLAVHHPDIYEFIRAKTVEGKISNFNISVAITDEFMEAVEKDADFTLRWTPQGKTDDPVHYTVSQVIRARDLWDEIIKDAWMLGDPGCLFIDAANRQNPCPTHYTLEATNPCGEQWLPPYSNCCLGSISVSHFASWDGTFDWQRYADTIRKSTFFLDDVVDANQYVEAVPELERAAQNERRIGLGLMGLADAMFMLGLRYGSPEGLDFASQVTEFARYHSMLASIERAKERGPFLWFEDSIYNLPDPVQSPGNIGGILGLDGRVHQFWSPPEAMVVGFRDFGRPEVDWSRVEDGIRAHGIRNACQFTYAPTGTISNVAGLEGSGCEPLFALAYVRTVMQEGQNIELPYLSGLFEEALDREGIDAATKAVILEKVRENGGSCQGIEEVPEEIRRVFVVAADVTPEEHVRTQAVLQAFVDNSISKTINLPNEATVEDVGRIYRLAYDLGCKGITIYRQGSRELEVLSTGKKSDATQIEEATWPTVRPLRIPAYAEDTGLAARVFPLHTAFGKIQVTVTELDGHAGRPFDVRLQLGKAGNDKNADIEAIGRMISLCLRSGVSVDDVVEQLEHIGGSTVMGFGDKRVRSAADGVAKLFTRLYLKPVEEVSDSYVLTEKVTVTTRASQQVTESDGSLDPERVCPKCHNATLVMVNGCRHCEIRLGGCGDYSGCE